jgi:hypothetical protein
LQFARRLGEKAFAYSASTFLLLCQKKVSKDKTAKRFWTALAGFEGFTNATSFPLDCACAEPL